jgi:phosphatidylglycerophosphate synthase
MHRLRDGLPNALSLSRIPLGMAFVVLYDTNEIWRFSAALSVAFLALLTDVADGRLARRWQVSSDAGALIDGLGDKAFYIAVYLVIAAENAAESLLLWGLIFREVALYGLRTIDGNRAINTKLLRWASLTYAFVIRMYFLDFVLIGWCEVTSRAVPSVLRLGFIFGYVALVIGFIGLAKLVQQITERA